MANASYYTYRELYYLCKKISQKSKLTNSFMQRPLNSEESKQVYGEGEE